MACMIYISHDNRGRLLIIQYLFPDYVVVLAQSIAGTSTAPDLHAWVQCTNNIETVEYNFGLEFGKRWQCPSSSVGRYVYLYFANPTSARLMCDVAVYAEEVAQGPTGGCE